MSPVFWLCRWYARLHSCAMKRRKECDPATNISTSFARRRLGRVWILRSCAPVRAVFWRGVRLHPIRVWGLQAKTEELIHCVPWCLTIISSYFHCHLRELVAALEFLFTLFCVHVCLGYSRTLTYRTYRLSVMKSLGAVFVVIVAECTCSLWSCAWLQMV
jgi:hypothetical protein